MKILYMIYLLKFWFIPESSRQFLNPQLQLLHLKPGFLISSKELLQGTQAAVGQH